MAKEPLNEIHDDLKQLNAHMKAIAYFLQQISRAGATKHPDSALDIQTAVDAACKIPNEMDSIKPTSEKKN